MHYRSFVYEHCNHFQGNGNIIPFFPNEVHGNFFLLSQFNKGTHLFHFSLGHGTIINQN